MSESVKEKHRWNFFRVAGEMQVRIASGDDIKNLPSLPDELWTILSGPVKGMKLDQRALELMDADQDGHVRVPEILKCLKWECDRLSDPGLLLSGESEMPLTAFSSTEDGEALRETAKALLSALGRDESSSLSLDEVLRGQTIFLKARFNGDGVVTQDSTDDETLKKLLGEIIATTGGITDRAGPLGVDEAKLEEFYSACQARIAWIEKSRSGSASILPLGDATAAAAAAVEAVRAKIDDYFARCRLASFDVASLKYMNRNEADYATIGSGAISADVRAVRDFPLSVIAPEAPLNLLSGVNPAWKDAVATFHSAAVTPLLGADTTELTEEAWKKVTGMIAPYLAWKGEEPGAPLAQLGEERLRALMAETDSRAAILDLIEKDKACATEINRLADLEKFIRFYLSYNKLLTNFVNFSDYYNPNLIETFRAGRLYIDGRVCHLCVNVENLAAHSTLAAAAKLFLAYVEITRSQTKETRVICTAITSGFANSIWVGRHGVFYDRDGNDWEAVVVKIVEHPVSIKEAFWAPWIKLSEMLGAQIKKILAAKNAAALSAASEKIDKVGTTPPPASPTKQDGAAMASSVAAIGIAIGLVGSAVGALIAAISGLKPWQTLLGVLAVFFIISGPSALLAWFKLRSRDLAPVLNACGWAVNKRLRMTMRLGREFTHEAKIPRGAKVELGDPYAESHRLRNTFFTLIIVGLLGFWAYRQGWLDRPLCALGLKEPPPVTDVAAPVADAPVDVAPVADAPADVAPVADAPAELNTSNGSN